jgi:hypothetical protein
MRAAANILFGIMLLVMQGMAALTPHSIEQEQPCQCCSCGSKACATSRTVPAPSPSPVVSQESARESQKVARPAQTPTDSARVARAIHPLSAPTVPLCSSSVSLHQLLCILLI